MRQHHTLIGTIVLTTLTGCSGLPICCEGGYEYRHRNVMPVAEAKTDDRDARLAAMERDQQRQMAETTQLQEQIADLQRKLAVRPEQPLAKTYDDLLTLLGRKSIEAISSCSNPVTRSPSTWPTAYYSHPEKTS